MIEAIIFSLAAITSDTTLTGVELLPGVAPLLEELRAKNFKVAIVSASRNMGDVISRLGIGSQFDACVDGDSIEQKLPAPDFFLYVARLLETPLARCLVVTGASADIQAARAAGMVTVGLGSEEQVGGGDMVLPDLDAIRIVDLTRAATWRVSEDTFEPGRQHYIETIFTQGNGYLGTRGTFEERFLDDRQATFVHGIWDDVPIVFTELANAPDWTALEIWIEGRRFSSEAEEVEDYARHLDLRHGVLRRRLRWSPGGDSERFDFSFERFPSLEDPHVMAARVQVQALDGPASVEIRASLNGNVKNEGRRHWKVVTQGSSSEMAHLVVRTQSTDKTLAMSTRLVTDDTAVTKGFLDREGNPGLSIKTRLEHGGSLLVDKFVSVFTSRDVIDPRQASQDKVVATAMRGYEILLDENKAAWQEFWAKSDVILEGDDEAQLAIRHALFQLRIAASSEDEHVSIGAKTLSGFGYRGHVFWDNEIFVLPFFTFTQPRLARNMLMYRWHTLPGARRKAAENGLEGAQFAWESAETGDEVTPRWVPDPEDPTKSIRIWTGDIQLHISADVAYAVWQYWQVTGDDEFMRNFGAPIILETAQFWGDRAEPVPGGYALSQVIGPDEYHHHVDNNAFTNAMVRWHLIKAIEVREWLRQTSSKDADMLDRRLGITSEALALWRDVSTKLAVSHDPTSGLIEQFDGFFQLPEVEWDRYEDRTESLQSLLGIEGANQRQVLKQADVILLLCLLRDQFHRQTWRANWEYYIPRTDHSYGSSLSPAIHAWAACELGYPELAYEHFMRAARADLEDIRGNAAEGIHAASAGGLWQALVFGFAGLHVSNDGHTLRPQLPSHWKRVAFRFCHRGDWQEVDLRRE